MDWRRHMEIIDIGYFELAFCLILVLAAGLASVALRLGLERDLLWGTVRTVAQLFLLGYVLRFIFAVEEPWLVLLILFGMILFAAWTIHGRMEKRPVAFFWPTLVSMLLSYFVIVFFATALVVGVDPWYLPQYVIPLGGMVVGNSMNAIALALDRLFSSLDKGRQEVELHLSLGATYREASRRPLKEAIRAGMIPTLNNMMAVGVVFIPGMMTGQILAGVDPMVAIKYQIMIMIMILISTMSGGILVTHLVRRLCFTANHQLKI